MRCRDLTTCFPSHHQLLTVTLVQQQHRRSGSSSSSSGRRYTTITTPTVLLDMDHTILRALPSSSSSSLHQSNVYATFEEEVMAIMGNNTPQARTRTTSASNAVATTEEEFSVLLHVPWVSSGEWYRSLETENNNKTPQSVREGHNNNNAERTDPCTTTGTAPAHATNRNEVTVAAGVVSLTLAMTPPAPFVTSRLRRMDIVLRPHLLSFLDELEGNWSVTEWRLCTANHPFNAMMVLFRIQQLLIQHKAGLHCRFRNNMTTCESNNIRDWILRRLSFANYACQSCCRRDTCQCGAEEDRPGGGMMMAPRKAHNHLFIPTDVDYVTNTERQPAPASNPAYVSGANLSPSSSSCTAGVDSSFIQWKLRDASFTNAILFDDTCSVFDATDALQSRKCIPVRRFGDRMQRVLSPKTLVEGNNANAPTDSRPPSHLSFDAQCRRVEGASVDDMMDSLFSSCVPATSSTMEAPPHSCCDLSDDDIGCECHEKGIAGRLVCRWRRLLLLEEGQCLESAPMARVQYDALWVEACADFGDALDDLQQQK
ncbi:Hypothetical protein, putative [Bodo saltans]|uniref:Uncharacterized protein n=1 Tax=Bodo saltans TaxID=75058 RepID=A0A0S4IYG8_BODSA|nr:Hypothetical protein, putative [Bodo saltans]|eukprot:CUG13288.1 Hypothetical protein, putative [Bodo saltans]